MAKRKVTAQGLSSEEMERYFLATFEALRFKAPSDAIPEAVALRVAAIEWGQAIDRPAKGQHDSEARKLWRNLANAAIRYTLARAAIAKAERGE
jgi:hypothetical protein